MKQQFPRYIVVEGPIGVGKTSLATRLASEFGSELILEGVSDNPFLERFYKNPRQAALSTQLYFLIQRVRQIQELRQGELFDPVRVADFLLEKDYLFAEITLDHHEFELYRQVYAHMTVGAPMPDLVVYLQAPVEILLERIRKRGRPFERLIEAAYLERINEAYARFFYDYNRAPLLIVNAAEIDPIGNDQDFHQLVERIQTTRPGRHYFNPLPFTV